MKCVLISQAQYSDFIRLGIFGCLKLHVARHVPTKSLTEVENQKQHILANFMHHGLIFLQRITDDQSTPCAVQQWSG